MLALQSGRRHGTRPQPIVSALLVRGILGQNEPVISRQCDFRLAVSGYRAIEPLQIIDGDRSSGDAGECTICCQQTPGKEDRRRPNNPALGDVDTKPWLFALPRTCKEAAIVRTDRWDRPRPGRLEQPATRVKQKKCIIPGDVAQLVGKVRMSFAGTGLSLMQRNVVRTDMRLYTLKDEIYRSDVLRRLFAQQGT